VHDDKRSGRPNVMTPDLVQQVEVKIRENRRFTITDLAEIFPNVSRKTVHGIVTENLHFQKLCARWVPKNQQAIDFFDTGIQKLVTRYTKCLDSTGDYVEM
jgi:hypothetical protein